MNLSRSIEYNDNTEKASFNYARILKQKKIDVPKPRFIRDNMNVDDIKNGLGMGQWDSSVPGGNMTAEQYSHLGTKCLLGKPPGPTRRRQFGQLQGLTGVRGSFQQNASMVLQSG